jgi:hypothetical protein
MRSRLPGKLRSSPLLLDAVLVKNGARFAKSRLIICALVSQILHKTDQAPSQYQA